ncbi:MAG: histidinol-phosphate transaminase [Steroidobacterales bacterium]
MSGTADDPLLKLAREEIIALRPYAHAAWEPVLRRLHANEAPWRAAGDETLAGLNRYPEPQPAALVARLARLYGVPATHVLATRGSDEAIDVLSRLYLRAGQDAILQCTPTFGMYQVAARIQGATVIEVPLDRNKGWSLDADRVIAAWTPQVKLVYLCSPNNPTANLFDADAIAAVCAALDGKTIVVIDEAYIEWCERPSIAAWLDRFSTLAVLRTMSKAYALAGARLGALLAAPALIDLARRIIPPYCLTQPTIEAALRVLEPGPMQQMRERIAALILEREHLRRGLEASPLVSSVWPSDANFLLVDSPDPAEFLRRTRSAGLIVRDLRAWPQLPCSLRVTVGTRAEHDALLRNLGGA